MMVAATDKFTGLTADRLRQFLKYDPETGVFTWRVQRGNQSKGSRAGCIHNGYLVIWHNGKIYKAHRLAWLAMTGDWPPADIDHINGDRCDNRFSNLRLATRTENCMNRKMQSNNNSGIKGVSWNEQRRKWIAKIRVNRRLLHLGGFVRIEDAAAAYERAAHKYYGEFARPERDTMPPNSPSVNLKELGLLD